MRKSTIVRLWLGGLAGILGGIVAAGIGTILMLSYGGTFSGPPGNEFQPTLDAFFWWMVGLICAGGFAVLAGGIVQVVAWIGALINTYGLPEKAWFVVLLIGGLLGLLGMAFAGLIVMIAYLLIGPDARPAGNVAATPPMTLAPAS